MRFTNSALLALPLLAAAAESPFEQYKAKFQNFISSFGAAVPNVAEKVAPAATSSKSKVAAKEIKSLTLSNWKETLYAPVKPEAIQPEEWWVLVTGGAKTCFGHCTKIEVAFNETAAKMATNPKSPHLGRVDCDDQPVLCNSWSASTGALWIFEMLPSPAPIDVYWKPFNLTSVTGQDLQDLYAKTTKEGNKEDFRLITSYFHPFNGVLADYGAAVPIGYALWALNVLPSWAMMLIVSFLSRSMM
ncbi:hypothetical protein B0H67DRAFT_558005 [Lasiosphaeris hirsuta]|uniref:Peptidyl-tRNA hydrolase n=1 Tax=Lasiosphaeris hirsuta TaxID=260670 RepID=A0AA39ZXH3_9PEZI|nr:hypothetical protein B0H67DRAFT_558005 [Lasiosphaeris hirsuta]